MGDWTGTVPSHSSGAKSKASKLQTLDDIATALTGAWTTWTPTLTNLTKGSGGTVIARYRRLGKTVDYFFAFTYGTGSAVGTDPRFTLPVTPASNYTGQVGIAQLNDASVGQRPGVPALVSGATLEVFYTNTTMFQAVITATVPFTWTTSDSITCWGTYEAA